MLRDYFENDNYERTKIRLRQMQRTHNADNDENKCEMFDEYREHIEQNVDAEYNAFMKSIANKKMSEINQDKYIFYTVVHDALVTKSRYEEEHILYRLTMNDLKNLYDNKKAIAYLYKAFDEMCMTDIFCNIYEHKFSIALNSYDIAYIIVNERYHDELNDASITEKRELNAIFFAESDIVYQR